MKRILVPLLLVALVGSASAKPPRKTNQPTAALLPLEAKKTDPATQQAIGESLQAELSGLGIFKVIPEKTSSARLAPMIKKKIYGPACLKNPACLKKLGLQIGATILFQAEIETTEDNVSIIVRSYDTKTGRVVREIGEKAGRDPEEIKKAATWALDLASGPLVTRSLKGKGKIKINCNISDAEIIINGKSFGKRVGKSFKVDAGVFDVLVKRPDYQPFRQVRLVRPEETQEITAELVAIEKPLVAVQAPAKEITPPPPVQPVEEKKEEKKPDLPAWAVFETPKKAEPLLPQPGQTTGALATTQPPSPSAPTASATQPVEKEGKPFWQTWWFWTIIGSAVAAGAGTTTYFLLSASGGQPQPGVGSAIIHWE